MSQQIAKPTVEKINHVLNMIKNEDLAHLDQQMWMLYEQEKMNDTEYNIRQSYIHALEMFLSSEALQAQFYASGINFKALTAYGSLPSRCAGWDSDMDLCICATGFNLSPLTVLSIVNEELLNYGLPEHQIEELEFISGAKVPILKFKINGISVDMCANVGGHPPASNLAAKYFSAHVQLDERFAVLVTFLKKWLKSEGGADYMREFPNSYSITLMVIHVLQWYGFIPNLHKTHGSVFDLQQFNDWEWTRHDEEHFKNPLDANFVNYHRSRKLSQVPVAQLLHVFAYHYGNQEMLNFCRFNTVSGGVERKVDRRHPIEIVDRYDVSNPGRTVRTSNDFAFALKSLSQHLRFPTNENTMDGIMGITAYINGGN